MDVSINSNPGIFGEDRRVAREPRAGRPPAAGTGSLLGSRVSRAPKIESRTQPRSRLPELQISHARGSSPPPPAPPSRPGYKVEHYTPDKVGLNERRVNLHFSFSPISPGPLISARLSSPPPPPRPTSSSFPSRLSSKRVDFAGGGVRRAPDKIYDSLK